MKQWKWIGLEVMVIGLMLLVIARMLVITVIDNQYYQGLANENRISLEILPADRGVIYDRFDAVLAYNTPEGREYVNPKALSLVLGFVAKVDEQELDKCEQEDLCLLYGDSRVGKAGIEKYFDKKLRGVDGGILTEKDVEGNDLRQLSRQEPVTGESIKLSLDLGLQNKAFEVMDNKKGAVIATDPNTGEVLALVSSPGFDSNLFSQRQVKESDEKTAQIEVVLNDQDLPMFNRVVGGVYPPGSTFKIVTAVAALEEGKIGADDFIEDTGEIKVGKWRYGNWYFDKYGQKEGKLNMVKAIARSNDIYFYKLGERLGMRDLSDWAKYFGAGNGVGIDLPGEAKGLMPDPDWKEEVLNESWFLGDTYISSIGQGHILMTPLQVNQLISVMAVDGKWCQPHLVSCQMSEDKCEKEYCKDLDISQDSLNLVRQGLKQVTETGGTAWPFFEFKVKNKRIELAGKTGTAEWGGEDDEPHAWMSLFAPFEKPEIALTVLLEAAGEGSSQAGPVAKEILEYWFSRK